MSSQHIIHTCSVCVNLIRDTSSTLRYFLFYPMPTMLICLVSSNLGRLPVVREGRLDRFFENTPQKAKTTILFCIERVTYQELPQNNAKCKKKGQRTPGCNFPKNKKLCVKSNNPCHGYNKKKCIVQPAGCKFLKKQKKCVKDKNA